MIRTLGLMSGTSTDGVDAVLGAFEAEGRGSGTPRWRVEGHVHQPFPGPLRQALLALNTSGADEIHRGALAANGLVAVYADAVRQLLASAGLQPGDIAAVGAHGQTVRHRPGEFDGVGYTVQLMNGALLAERCGIDVVCDFRSRDVAAGGQGAPLVPAFHAMCFGAPDETLAVLNIGGIANLTRLSPDEAIQGFDCGPGNVLMDLWAERQLGRPFDDGGQWAATGSVDERLMALLLAEPFLGRSPPKSTGRDLFHADWLATQLARRGELGAAPSPPEVMATLTAFTARAAAQALQRWMPEATACLVCGGGARNQTLLRHLGEALPGVRVTTTAERGLPPDQVEAMAFAWLAWMFLARQPAGRPTVTGATGPRILGALYPAGTGTAN